MGYSRRLRRIELGLLARAALTGRAHVAMLLLSASVAAQSHVVGWGIQNFNSAWNEEPFVEIAASGHHTLARRGDGSIVGFGDDSCGSTDVPALPPGRTCVEIATGKNNSLARLDDGSVVAWGDNSHGQCNVPALPPGLTYVEISAGTTHSVARRSDGMVVAWGDNSCGQCNVPALPAGRAYLAISAGWNESVAVVGAVTSPTAYCTAGTTTYGCVASIFATGMPSASLASNFALDASDLEGNQQGLFFYGLDNSGFAPSPWGASYLCVKGPRQRTLALNTGGTSTGCDGSFELDWNAYITANAGALGNPLAAGQHVFAQAWFRDPPSPKTSALSNALAFVLQP